VARVNDAVAELFQEYADLIAITGGEAFRARVYEKAARSIAGYPGDVAKLDRKALEQIPNVGGSTAGKIQEYLSTGRIEAVEKLRGRIPAGVRELTRIPGLGPKRAVALYEELGVGSVADLVTAIEDGRVAQLRGFGAKGVANIQHGIELLAASGGRVLISEATAVAEEIRAALAAVPGCERVDVAGSLRRMRETIGDVDILVAAADSAPLMAAFVALPLVAEVVASGPTKTSIRTGTGLQVDLRVVPLRSWGSAMQYFTGSQAHNIRTREIAVRAGLKLSEYGLFRVEDDELLASQSEEEVYARLGLPWVPPTLREDRGEVAAALRGTLPELVQVGDVRGDLHTHTTLTDGVSTLEEMLAAARDRGYDYYAVTDHAKDLPMQRMTDAKMLAQRERLRELAGDGEMALLHGTELNIGPDGEVDWDAVFEAAAGTGTAMEINAFPDRLDLNDELILRARGHGVRFAINTDSHSTVHLNHLRYGVGTAQRGWLTADDVINTWPLSRLREFISAKRQRG